MKDQTNVSQEADFRIAPGVYMGVLMSPQEVARATAGRGDPVYGSLHRWTMCGDVSPAVFDLLEALHNPAQVNERVTAFTSPSGSGYVVFTHQVANFQHRFFVPLYDARVKQCLAEVTQNGNLGYSLAGERNQAIVWGSHMKPRDLSPLRALVGDVSESRQELVLEEYARLLAEMRDPLRIPSVLEGVAVRHASVTAIPPTDLVTQLACRSMAQR